MKIKVLYYLNNLGIGGTEKTAVLFAEHLDRSKFQVYFAYQEAGDQTRLPELLRAMTHEDDRVVGLQTKAELKPLVERNNIDIVHVFRSGFPEFPEPAVDLHVRHFVETNVFGFFDNNVNVEKSLFMSKYLMDHTEKLMANAGYQNLQNIIDQRFDFVNNPVETPATHERMTSLAYDIDPRATILGRVGRPDDGIYNPIAVKASWLLHSQGIPIHWLVVAPPQAMIRDLNRFAVPYTAIDPTVDADLLSRAYNSMHIYAHFRADGETFGVNIAEAMIHKLPVVTHRAIATVTGMGVFQSQLELVDDGKTGYHVFGNSHVEYADALRKLIENPEDIVSFGENGFNKAIREYHVTPVVKKLEGVYEEITNV